MLLMDLRMILYNMLLNKRDNWNFLEIDTVSIGGIHKEVLGFYDEWLIDTSRQNTFETHQSTFAFEMIGLDYLHGLELPGICHVKRSLATKEAKGELAKIYSKLESTVDGRVIRAEFISMSPYSRVRTHKDRSDLLYVSRRFHIPIKTNGNVVFVTGGESRHLEEGKIYELNNIKYHSVHNRSSESRIHLIVDVLPRRYCDKIEYSYEIE